MKSGVEVCDWVLSLSLVWKHTQKTAGQASVSSSCHCKFAVLGVMRIQASSYMTLHEHRRAASVAKINVLMCADLHAQKKAKELIHKMSLGHRSTRTQLYLHKKSEGVLL
jgi:hypothetical protein